MNEAYEWLYDHYALPLIHVRAQAGDIKETILFNCDASSEFFLRDQLDTLCTLWGMDSFALGLQLGLRLMAGQHIESLENL